MNYLGLTINNSEDLLQLREAIRDMLSAQNEYCDVFALLGAYVSYVNPQLCIDRCNAERTFRRLKDQVTYGKQLLFQDAVAEMGPQLCAKFDGERELYKLRYTDPQRQFKILWNTASSNEREAMLASCLQADTPAQRLILRRSTQQMRNS